jgi:hypothetical protein
MNWITAWIDPNGIIYEFDANGHKQFALDYAKLHPMLQEPKEPWKELISLGWMRVTNRSEKEFCIIPENKKWNRQQERAYVDLCLKYDRMVTNI